MTSDLMIIDQTSFPHERTTVIDYFPLHKTPVAANPPLSSLAHTLLHRPNRHKINIILYTEHKNKMCRACTSTLHKKIWGCLNSTCYTHNSWTVWYIWIKTSKWVWSRNTTITNCRQTHGTAKKSHTTITRHQEDKLSKTTSSLFPIKMFAKLEGT